ncbi:MAG: aspartate aminotransferase family protein [Verrucomicrobia bacterium]|nr:aspartate aminotransferase family protein [Verrucomicrobiota bacterium]MCH8526767.1 aspartate aminotransferase family protein [Kiritimatiellia bacterium]
MSESEESKPTPPVKRSLSEQLAYLHGEFHAPNYAPSLSLVKGRGAYVWDANGKKYLDFVSGIAVTALGHSHPAIVKAVKRQAGRLMHVSNLYYNDQAPFLAKQLCELAGLGGKVFFCNSGAEANEGLIKLARKWGSEQDRFEVITFRNSFHGRTLATLTATGQEKVQYGFAPLPEGFKYAQYNDLESVKAQLTPKTAAVMLELVQAEGGVVPADPEFVKGLAKLCRERNVLLLVDEIQTGVGRTGTMFAWQGYGIEPDGFSLAKGLGGGFPIGAVMMGPKLKDVFQPGSHGTTFGGQPLGCAAARAVLDTIAEKALDTNAEAMGYMLQSKLKKVVDTYSFVRAVRGKGLLVGLVIDRPAKDLEKILTRRGLLTVCTAGNVIRMLPPLTLTARQVKQAVKIIDKACQEWQAELLNQQGN